MVDQWRWQVFSGQVTPANYNQAWWALRQKYQGIASPEPRGEEFFDAGREVSRAGQHAVCALLPRPHPAVPVSPRARRRPPAARRALHRCSIYESKAAGERLNKMMAMGLSKPWPDALEALTGSKQMDATAIIDYFAPLQKWLDEQIKGKPVGW